MEDFGEVGLEVAFGGLVADPDAFGANGVGAELAGEAAAQIGGVGCTQRSTNPFASGNFFCDIGYMSAVSEREEPRPLSAEDLFHFWSRHVEDFMHWQRKNFVVRRANPEELKEHAKRLDLMVGLTLHMYSVASSAMPGALRTISGRLRQLQDSRALVDNPMSDEEADAILRQVFPDEPAVGRSA